MNDLILNFELTVDEANAVLQALGASPYNQVAGVIPKILEQGEAQIAAWREANPAPEQTTSEASE